VGLINSTKAQEMIKKEMRIATNPYLRVNDFFIFFPSRSALYERLKKDIFIIYDIEGTQRIKNEYGENQFFGKTP